MHGRAVRKFGCIGKVEKGLHSSNTKRQRGYYNDLGVF